MKVFVPPLLSSVPSSTVSVLPLRPETIPERRSKPEPWTLLPANTSVAVNDTADEVSEFVKPFELVLEVSCAECGRSWCPHSMTANCAKPALPADGVPLIS